jgi:hypothetical protein
VLDLVTDLQKDFQSFTSKLGRVSDQPLDVRTGYSELLLEENATHREGFVRSIVMVYNGLISLVMYLKCM